MFMCPQAAGLVKSDPMNTTKGRVPHNYSSFDESLSYKKYMLLRYADYSPSFEMEGVPEDDIRLNTKDMIDSLSLNSPFKGSIRKIKESFKVPNMAMLPFNWDQIYTQPSVGGDVPQDANTVFLNFPDDFASFWLNLLSQVQANVPASGSTDAVIASWLTALLRMLVVGEYVYSKGSLLNKCGYKASAQFEHLSPTLVLGSYDQFFDYVIYNVFRDVRFFTLVDPVTNRRKIYRGLNSVPFFGAPNERFFGSFRAALDAIRENPLLFVSFSDSVYASVPGYDANLLTSIAALVSNKVLYVDNIRFILPPSSVVTSGESELTELNPNTLNYQRLVAYQLIYFHFFTNSSLDPVYSAELYRQYVQSLITIPFGSSAAYFTLNGQQRQYDYLSGHCIGNYTINSSVPGTVYSFTYASLSADDVTGTSSRNLYRFAVLAAIFATRHSLRYGDYFVGSRPRPLAPINTNVPVVGNNVSVIDITQKQWSQKFGNAVMRARQKIENYTEMLFGRKPDIDYHNPLFLSREIDVIYGDEVQNTGAAQVNPQGDGNSRTANMRGGLGQFTFTFHNDDQHPCVYMQIISFDIKRGYTRSVDRQFLHIDRYDMFNPNFQYIGDQPIYGIELGYPDNPLLSSPGIAAVMGYTSRDMEYKQRFDVVCDGFEDNLPGWILTDRDRSQNHDGVLDVDFIRNENSELDRFYLSITGYSLGTYFHFICITQNNVFAKRAMAVDPQILG